MHVVESLAPYNLDTLTVDIQGAAAHEAVIKERVLSELSFTPQQQQAIAVGGELYRARMRSITAAQQQLQGSLGQAPPAGTAATAESEGGISGGAGIWGFPRTASGSNGVPGPAMGELGGAPAAATTAVVHAAPVTAPLSGYGVFKGEDSTSSSVSCGRSSSYCSGSGRLQQLDTLVGRLRELDALSAATTQVERLLTARGQLRLITWVWLVGCLSWPQLTLFATLCWPYSHRPAVLGETLMKQWLDQQQQQQQQLQQAKAGSRCAGAVPGAPQQQQQQQ
jgi:hypothetical protein